MILSSRSPQVRFYYNRNCPETGRTAHYLVTPDGVPRIVFPETAAKDCPKSEIYRTEAKLVATGHYSLVRVEDA